MLNDGDFKEELRELGGTPPEILENDELYRFFSPILRADYKILEIDEDPTEKEITIRTPIYAIMGGDEETSSQIENWRRFTTGDFQFEILSGGHFFIYDHPATLAGIIQGCFDSN
ncbi:thioesterase II family protein [Chitinophaga sp. HK235]|uniref:thioesterase II family protein n=1 Tax=Chitinophaga sp. HK235 TaxID=2952571 RepID=UPI001BAA5F61|nr:thioesterase domain-containing protein [Chitinophaga sp. HK235]